jgi:hypothetical protein
VGVNVSPQKSRTLTTILTIDINLSGWRAGANSWAARVEVAESITLNELHYTILQLVEFDNDHLHHFFSGRDWRGRRVAFGEPAASPFEFNEAEEAPLSKVFPLPKGHRLYYHFDFGDDWLFAITRRPNRKQADLAVKYPRLVEEKGHRPKQYPHQDDEG